MPREESSAAVRRLGGGCGFVSRRRRSGIAFPADADDFGDAGLLHGYAVKDAAGLHGFAVVGDDDELRLAAHFADETGEAADIGFVEWGIDFVEDAERAGLVAENGDQER